MLRSTSAFARSTVKRSIAQQHGAQVPLRALADSSSSAVPSPQTESFVRGLFRGEIKEESVFPYPSVLSEEEVEMTAAMIDPVNRFFSEVNDAAANDTNESVPEEVTKGLADLGAFGLQVPEQYDGVGLNNTQYARMVEIVGAYDLGVGIYLGAHQSIGFKGILIAGNEEQKAKYLPAVATAEKIAAFALTEPSSGSDANSIQTRATLSEDGKHFILNGSKIWISNGGLAEVFTVFAQTEVDDPKTGGKKDKVTAFIVERGFGGVSNGPPEKKMGIKCSNTAEVYFEDCKVPVENVLGEVGGGFKVAMNILNNGRFGMVAALSGTCKALIKGAAEHAVSRTQFGQKIKDFGLIQRKFAQMATRTYAAESMAYLISSNMDRGSTDFQMEAAIGKIFASEAAWFVCDEAIQVMGGLGFMKEYPYERVLRDLRIFRIFEGTNDILRLFVGLTGAQATGEKLKGVQQALKNPVGNMGTLLNMGQKQVRDRLGLAPAVTASITAADASLSAPAGLIAAQAAAFNGAVESLLIKHGKGIMNEQMMVNRIADSAIDLYAMAAVVSRATRAIAEKSETAQHEAALATAFCLEANMRVTENLRQVKSRDGANLDAAYQAVAKDIFEKGQYFAKHPLGM